MKRILEEEMIDKVRELALKVLYEVNEKQAYSNIALDEALKQARKTNQELSKKDIGFISEVVYGTTSWRLTIDEIIKKYSNIKLKKISPWILNILRMSIYQIVFLDKVPKSAAVNEGVNLAKRYGHKASSNFVNAILRKVDKKDLEEFSKIENVIERISKTTSMPEWIIEELLKDKSKKKDTMPIQQKHLEQKSKEERQIEQLESEVIKEVEDICKNSNIKPKLQIRVNTLKTTKNKLKEELEQQGVKVEVAEVENFLQVEDAKNIEKMKEFQEGKFTIQDEVAGLIPIVLNPKPKEVVLDACSSPGRKDNSDGRINAK